MPCSKNKLLFLIPLDDFIFKAGGGRGGLIQSIVTYVRNGHTITRKQWVRSEFEKHAKKDEEEKRETILRMKEREKDKKKKDTIEAQEIADRRGNRAASKLHREDKEHEGKGHHSKPKTKIVPEAEKEKLRKLKEQEKQDKIRQEEQDNKKRKLQEGNSKEQEHQKDKQLRDKKADSDKSKTAEKKKKPKLRTGKQKGTEQAVV